jgi:hypothetical protein
MLLSVRIAFHVYIILPNGSCFNISSRHFSFTLFATRPRFLQAIIIFFDLLCNWRRTAVSVGFLQSKENPLAIFRKFGTMIDNAA